MLLFFLACMNTENVNALSLQGGTWTVESGEAFSIRQTGVGYFFTVEDYLFAHCIMDCVGTIRWPEESLVLDASSSLINLHSIERLEGKLQQTDIMVQDVSNISIQSIKGDIWIEAPQNAEVSILASSGDVDIVIPNGLWKTRLYGDTVVNPVTTESEAGGVLEVFNADGNIRISEIKPLSSY